MFGIHSEEGYVEVLPGIAVKTLNHGGGTLMSEFRLAAGAALPEHAHVHEQTGYLLSGSLRLTIGPDSRRLVPGDSWNVPPNVAHRADVLADSVAVEVFAPAREDYLKFESGTA
jgi:quercetin dioxygenase-like cupin family protein